MTRSLGLLVVSVALFACGGGSGAAAAHPAGNAPSPCPEGPPCADPGELAGQAVTRLDGLDEIVLPSWESEVRTIMLETYDHDRSSAVDTRAEVDAILCEVWLTIDEGYRARSNQGDSVRTAYGFAPFTFYVGELGIGRSEREFLRQKLLGCGIR